MSARGPDPAHEIEALDGVLVVADLHLDLADEHGCDAFARSCDSLSGLAHLVVLGDLFDAWVGPAHARLPAARTMRRTSRLRPSSSVIRKRVHGPRSPSFSTRSARAGPSESSTPRSSCASASSESRGRASTR